ncbi:MAG: 16S rRNA (adenine(1518)-N(6)/adenine(1519)-N(6))-dimethyltransferase RsmA [Sporolactobacillus sp.]
MSGHFQSPAQLQMLIRRHAFTLKKSLGQNFLVDGNILGKIVDAADLHAESLVLEIGPGAGALTRLLAERAAKVAAIEIDQRLKPLLAETLSGCDNVSVCFADVLAVDLEQFLSAEFPGEQAITVVANLPYYVTTPILMKLLSASNRLAKIVVMVQKEVAERLEAHPGTKSYGSLSIAVQYQAVPDIVMTVPKTVFIPQPNVDSAVLRVTMRQQKQVQPRDEHFFFKLVRASFTQRRKTLVNNLTHNLFTKEQRADIVRTLERVGISPERRGETLSIAEFADLSDALLEMLD